MKAHDSVYGAAPGSSMALAPDVEHQWTQLHFRVETTLAAQRPSRVNHAWQGVAAAVRELVDTRRRPMTTARARWAHRRGAELADLLTALDKEITTSIDGEGMPVDYCIDERWVAAQECRRFFDRFIGPALLHAHLAHSDAVCGAAVPAATLIRPCRNPWN